MNFLEIKSQLIEYLPSLPTDGKIYNLKHLEGFNMICGEYASGSDIWTFTISEDIQISRKHVPFTSLDSLERTYAGVEVAQEPLESYYDDCILEITDCGYL